MLGTIEEPEFKISGIRLKARFLATAVAIFIRAVACTLRIRHVDQAGLLTGKIPGPCIVVFWHNRLFGMSIYLYRRYPKWSGNRRGLVALTSFSGEGTLLTMILESLGARTVRGSSSRRGSVATRALLREMKRGYDVAMTPDGPRGPRYQLSAGPLFLARQTGCPIVSIQVEYSRCLRLGTWDRFMIPLPFSSVTYTTQPPSFVPVSSDPGQIEKYRTELERHFQPGNP